MITPSTLQILCCPETHQPLSFAPPPLIEEVNGKIAAGTLKNRAGKVLGARLDAGLLRADGKILYPVRNSIPVLIIDEAIPL